MVLSAFYTAQGLCKCHGKCFTLQPNLDILNQCIYVLVNMCVRAQHCVVIHVYELHGPLIHISSCVTGCQWFPFKSNKFYFSSERHNVQIHPTLNQKL